MKKIIICCGLIAMSVALAGCAASRCEVEPIVQENHKLIVPPNFGQMPK